MELEEQKEEIKKNVKLVLDNFVNQEMGNKVTMFNMQGLVATLLSVIDNGIQISENKQ